MEPRNKFRLKQYLLYLALEPWKTKLNMPNLSTINWALIIISLFFRFETLLFISIIIGLFLHMRKEWKSGVYISWYRENIQNPVYKEHKKIMKEVRKDKNERKNDTESFK